MKLLKILTITALVLFPFGELLRWDVANNVAIKPLDIVVCLAAAYWTLLLLFQRSKDRFSTLFVRSKNILLPLLLFALIGLVALLFNLTWLKPNEVFAASLYLVRWVSYAALVGIVLQFDEKFKKKLIALLFIDGIILLLAGFVQYFFFNSLKSLYYLGWDEHMHRMVTTFFDPNFAGAFFVLFFLFLAGTIHVHLQKKEYKLSKILGILLVLTLIAIFLTFSRAALLMLIVGSIVFLFLIKKKKLILVLLAAMALFVAIDSPKFYDENMNLFRIHSSSARIANDSVAWTIIQDHPILGVGFNSYRYTKRLYGMDHDWVKAPSHADAGVDNSGLFVLATTGVIGFIAYCGLLITILRRAYYLHKKYKSVLAVVVISSFVGLFVNAMFINSLFFPALMLWMWMMIGLMESSI